MSDNIQLGHEDHQPSEKTFPLSIVTNNITDPLNVGSLFRLCDALGIEQLYLCGETPVPPNSKIKKTSRATEKNVRYQYVANAEKLVEQLIADGFTIVSLEITSSSLAINSAAFNAAIKNTIKSKSPVCLILGSENTGVSESLLALSHLTVHIPMLGKNSSMNVVSAASISCYQIINNS